MPVESVHGNDKIEATRGLVAYERGPIVYCLEDVGGGLGLAHLSVPSSMAIHPQEDPSLLGGVTLLVLDGLDGADKARAPVTAIPYFAWDNRGLAPMAVWLPEAPQAAVARNPSRQSSVMPAAVQPR